MPRPQHSLETPGAPAPFCDEGGNHNGSTANLVHILEGIDDVVRQAGEQVDDEPGLQVVHADQRGVRDHLPARPHERGVEVEHDVHQEDDVHDAVDHQPGDVVLLGLEGDVVGHHDGRVEGEDEDDPVPRGLEGAVVQDDVRRGLGRLLLVLGEDLRTQLQNLGEGGEMKRG